MITSRFDRQVFRVLATLAALTAIVGAIALGVNLRLVNGHERTVAQVLPMTEAATRLQGEAELAQQMAASLPGLRDRAAMAREVQRLRDSLDRLAAHADALPPALRDATPLADIATIRDELSGVEGRIEDAIGLQQQVDAQSATLTETGRNLSALVGTQVDLGRVRVTAAIAALREGVSTANIGAAAPELDRLADSYVFAFERVHEMARSVELMRMTTARLASETRPQALPALRAALETEIAAALRRLDYLPATREGGPIRDGLTAFAQVLSPDGLADLAAARLAARDGVDAAAEGLLTRLSQLRSDLAALTLATQTETLARIDADARQAVRLTRLMLVVIALSLLIAAGLAWQTRTRLLSRLRRLTEQLLSVAQGATAAPLRISGDDEIGRIETAVNTLGHLAAEARRLRGQLEAAVGQRTRELVDEIHASEAARAEAEAATRRTLEFTARMSHEIRTPLNGVIGLLTLAADEATPAQRSRLDSALTAAADLQHQVNDILELARSAEPPGDGVQPPGAGVHFAIRDLIAQVFLPLKALAEAKGLMAEVDLAPGVPDVLFGDVVKIRQVLTNLTSNAVKYTSRGRIALLIDHAPDPARDGLPVLSFSLADTGAGMDPAQAARALKAPGRADWAQRSEVEGAGLGLMISQRLTESLGGALSFETAPGVGSRFTLTVPLWLGDPGQITGPDRLQARALGRTVLVVEDHPVNRIVARGFLDRLGCRSIEATTVAEAMSAIAAGGFDHALVDLDLPDGPGQEVIDRLRQSLPHCPVAALTAATLDDSPQTRQRLGVDAVLGKPVSPRALADFLAQMSDGASEGLPDAGGEAIGTAPVLAAISQDVAALGAGPVAEMIAAFLEDLDPAVALICDQSGPARAKAAHRLKGSALNFGLGSLCDLLAGVERDPDRLDPTALTDEAEAARQALTAAADQLGSVTSR